MDRALEKLTIPSDLALRFFGAFSRFEYALKVTPAFRQPGNGEAKADWRAYATAVAPMFDLAGDPALKAACAYVTQANLRYYSVQAGQAEWRPYPLPAGITDAEKAVRLIKQIRNNLFHGGKYAHDPEGNPERDEKLVAASLVILENLLRLDEGVQAIFEN
jgi:hypothetical protein